MTEKVLRLPYSESSSESASFPVNRSEIVLLKQGLFNSREGETDVGRLLDNTRTAVINVSVRVEYS